MAEGRISQRTDYRWGQQSRWEAAVMQQLSHSHRRTLTAPLSPAHTHSWCFWRQLQHSITV